MISYTCLINGSDLAIISNHELHNSLQKATEELELLGDLYKIFKIEVTEVAKP